VEDLELPRPDVNLGIGSASHSVQTGRIMIALEPLLERTQPDWVFTVGDVNSTLAAALVAVKLGIPVAHVEAGLRSHDRSMPEEINRMLTDRISDALFTTEPSANENLRNEGIEAERIRYVGNVMIDSLDRYRTRAAQLDVDSALGLEPEKFVLVTLHRPSNVDAPARLATIMSALGDIACYHPVVFPMHPRTARNIRQFRLESQLAPINALGPVRYLEFLCLMDRAGVVITDSGGVQEETSVLGVPCITLRANTERPITLSEGTNRLLDGDLAELVDIALEAVVAERRPCRPALWDGHAAERIAEITLELSACHSPSAGAGLRELDRLAR
jgi:UDP-N-acetylglucosamine 2-epimerase (non-hydrolysing)